MLSPCLRSLQAEDALDTARADFGRGDEAKFDSLSEMLASKLADGDSELVRQVAGSILESAEPRAKRWWVGWVPALSECSPAEAALESALAKLAAEAPEIQVVLFLPGSVPESHPIRRVILVAQVESILDEEYLALSAGWPLPRIAILGEGGRALFESSVPRGWADETNLFELLVAFRRWAIDSR